MRSIEGGEGPEDEMGTDDEGSGTPVGRSRRELLIHSPVGKVVGGKVLSTIGVWITNIAGAIVVYDLTASAAIVGIVSVVQFTPQVLLSPFTGARADRADRRRQVVLGVAVTCSGAAGPAFWGFTRGFTRPSDAFVIIAAAGLVGIGFSLSNPATQALIPSLVRKSELPNAVALSSLPMVVARAAGPALGALLVTSVGVVATFSITLLLHLGFLVAVATIKMESTAVAAADRGDTRVRAGLEYAMRDRRILALLVGIATIGVSVDPVVTLAPSIADAIGAQRAFVGTLASMFGIGAGVGFIVLSRVRMRVGEARLAALGLNLIMLGMILLIVAREEILASVAMGVAGIGMSIALNGFTTLLQSYVPNELRGRVMALWSIAFVGSRPITALTTGPLADATSVRWAIAVVVLAVAAGAWFARPTRIALPDAAR